MAFLCPVRIRKGKRKKDGDTRSAPPMGRITGSASIETLVRVGMEKEAGLSADSRMVVLHDFTPCVDDELAVRRGQLVNVLYQENDWVYVIADDNREGFIPHSYCAPSKKQLPASASSTLNRNGTCDDNSITAHSDDGGGSSSADGKTVPDVHPFYKDPSGVKYIVLYTFIARDENDVSVERGEFVTVLNKEDPDWLWIVRSDGQEGFVPSGFVCPAEVLQGFEFTKANNSGTNGNTVSKYPSATNPSSGAANNNNDQTATLTTLTPQEDAHPSPGSELVILYDYKPQAADDLSVRRGDWVYADLSNQTVDGWLWAYHPKARKYGFIPKAYARPPAMTSL